MASLPHDSRISPGGGQGFVQPRFRAWPEDSSRVEVPPSVIFLLLQSGDLLITLEGTEGYATQTQDKGDG